MNGCSLKKNNIVWLRCLAIIMVVFGHSIIIYSSSWNLYETERVVPILNTVKRFIDVVQMPLYFSISGYLYYSSKKRNTQSLTSLVRSKMKRLLIPFLVFSIGWLLPVRMWCAYPSYMNQNLADLLWNKILLGYDCGHLWFLPVLFLIFVIAGSMNCFFEKHIVSGGVKEIVFFIIMLGISMKSHVFVIPLLQNTFCYLFWFLLGGTIFRNESLLDKWLKIVPVSILIGGGFAIYLIDSKMICNILCILIVAALYSIAPRMNNGIVNKIDKNSFGVYLIHSPLVYIMFSQAPNCSPILMVIVNFVLFGGVAYYMTDIIRKWHLGLIIGE